MKSNKEKVYDYIRLHADEKADRGISTAYIADAMELQRTNVSSILNLLVQEGRIQKCNGRPVLYKVGREESTLEECFSDLIGADGLDIFLRLVYRHADVLREREGGNAVYDAEIHGLRVRAHLLGDLIAWHAEDLRGCDGVDVLAGQKRLLHRLVIRDVREQPQLDLAIVRVDEHAAVRGDEHAAKFAAELRTRGDVL